LEKQIRKSYHSNRGHRKRRINLRWKEEDQLRELKGETLTRDLPSQTRRNPFLKSVGTERTGRGSETHGRSGKGDRRYAVR